MIDVIIVPQGAEYQAVKKGLKNLKIQPPLIMAIPIGVQQIEETLEKQKFWQARLKNVLMMGLCGSLSSQHSVGDAVLYQDCYSNQKSENIATDGELNQFIGTKLDRKKAKSSISLVSGFTSDRVISTIREKQQLADTYTATVVDMESFAYLQLLQQKNIAVSIIRIVSDDLQQDLPNLEGTIGDRGQIKPLAMTTAMLQQPIASLRLIRSSLQGLQKLEQITTDIFRIQN